LRGRERESVCGLVRDLAGPAGRPLSFLAGQPASASACCNTKA
jgi:hypothetical protein